MGIVGVIAVGLFFACNQRVTSPEDETVPDSTRIQLPVFGSEYSLDIVTWNIQNFPKLGNQTVTDVAEIIRDLDADIYGMQEIEDTLSFRQLINNLPEYDGIYSSDIYGGGEYQKTAVVYRKNLVVISDKEMLFTNDSYSFPRPPLKVYIRAGSPPQQFDFTLIVQHLKALEGEENEARRRSACEELKRYLDQQIVSNADKDFIVIGDWNDELDDPVADNVFQVFLNDPQNYWFLTEIFARNASNNNTYIGFPSVIDHILITGDLRNEYTGGTIQVLKIDQQFSAYVYEVSDHRPVGVRFPVF